MASIIITCILKKINILIINGPNLNLTGQREQLIYGNDTLEYLKSIPAQLKDKYPGLEITLFQSNHEGEIIDIIHKSLTGSVSGIAINPGGFTHTSVAIADAIRATGLPVVEVHLSNIYSREEFRRHNLIAHACKGSISGLGITGYKLAAEYLAEQIVKQD